MEIPSREVPGTRQGAPIPGMSSDCIHRWWQQPSSPSQCERKNPGLYVNSGFVPYSNSTLQPNGVAESGFLNPPTPGWLQFDFGSCTRGGGTGDLPRDVDRDGQSPQSGSARPIGTSRRSSRPQNYPSLHLTRALRKARRYAAYRLPARVSFSAQQVAQSFASRKLCTLFLQIRLLTSAPGSTRSSGRALPLAVGAPHVCATQRRGCHSSRTDPSPVRQMADTLSRRGGREGEARGFGAPPPPRLFSS